MNWRAELGEVHEVRDEDGSRICIITQLRGRHGMGGRIGGEESAKRTHLISAAPDLLEALIAITDQLERVGDCRKDEPFIEAARAAIAKASTI